ncbi:hypothetical protein NYS50_03410 [Curtobacterium flaccumfaciens pv. flaccumfaciens]|uniref:hypothetical protein n=1 Tax=Curtobacterium flaccumfaciens TaxID=2035 RepID=UPI00217E0EFA|nr:hypothetical protein [Curtobacterium flaccumfaciens]MCS6546918.1 hypothetical protein [Curtobacterium flaccumfaciens pv. flaccumfaciens]
MKYVNYAGTVRVLTSDTIADAVIRYAAALHQSRLSDVVSIPTADDFGVASTVEVLLAPSVPVAVEPAPDDDLEPEGDAFLIELARRTEAVLAVDPNATPPDLGR